MDSGVHQDAFLAFNHFTVKAEPLDALSHEVRVQESNGVVGSGDQQESSPVVQEDRNDDDHVQHRFKVVKVVSTDPLTKGRWECMDYFDQTVSSTTACTSVKAPNNDSSCVSPTQQLSQPPQFPPSQSMQQQSSHQEQPPTPQNPTQLQSPQESQSLQQNLHFHPAQQLLPQQLQQQHLQEQHTESTSQFQQVSSQPSTSVHSVIQVGPQVTQQMATSQTTQSHQGLTQTPSQQQGGQILSITQQEQQLFLQQQQQQLITPQSPQARLTLIFVAKLRFVAEGGSIHFSIRMVSAIVFDNNIDLREGVVAGKLF